MKILFDLFPVIIFFIAFRIGGIFLATTITICVTIAQVILFFLYYRKVDLMVLVSIFMTCIFGGATLVLHNSKSIQWKPTILYWIYSASLIVSRYVFGKNLLEKLIGNRLPISKSVCDKINISLAIFFAILGSANLYILSYYNESQWVNFKLFGTIGAIIIFIILQSLWLKKYLKQK